MIVWLNGAFGVGKTQTAYALARRLKNAFVFDPENAGFYLRKNWPESMQLDDFQDHPEWRQINRAMLVRLASAHAGVVIVPMTVNDPVYFAEMTAGLAVRHVLLAASRETLLRRLARRGDGKRSWTVQQVDRCLAAQAGMCDALRLETDGLSHEAVVEAVAAACGFVLLPETRGPVRRWWSRVLVWLRHVR